MLISSELKLTNGWRFCLWPFRQDDFFSREDANDWLRNFLTTSETSLIDTPCANHESMTYQRAFSP
jgi:hypothetical protein